MEYGYRVDTQRMFMDNYYLATIKAYEGEECLGTNTIFINANVACAFLEIHYNRKWMYSLAKGTRVKAKDGILVIDRYEPSSESDYMAFDFYQKGLYLYIKGIILRSVLVEIGKSLGKGEDEVFNDISQEFCRKGLTS